LYHVDRREDQGRRDRRLLSITMRIYQALNYDFRSRPDLQAMLRFMGNIISIFDISKEKDDPYSTRLFNYWGSDMASTSGRNPKKVLHG